jgi:hypothetical protein
LATIVNRFWKLARAGRDFQTDDSARARSGDCDLARFARATEACASNRLAARLRISADNSVQSASDPLPRQEIQFFVMRDLVPAMPLGEI